MIQWTTVEDARNGSGLRLVLARGSYGGFSESAKNIMHVKKIPYAAVPQTPFGENLDLVAWTGVRNNPVAVYNDEPPRNSWLDILNLAERLAPEPRLLPADSAERALVVGLSNEIMGEAGLVWSKRISTVAKAGPSPGLRGEIMRREYRADGADADREVRRQADIIAAFGARLQAQKRAGSRYLVGDALTAVDIYWATFSNLYGPLAGCPIPEPVRSAYVQQLPEVAAVFDPILFDHRDYVYATYLPPMDFD